LREKPIFTIGKANRTIPFIVLTALMACPLVPLQGEGNVVEVQGRIRDTKGMPVGEASVTARNIATGSLHLARSGVDGTFAITGLVPGIYDIGLGDQEGRKENSASLRMEVRPGARKEIELVAQTVSVPRNAGTQPNRPRSEGSSPATTAQQISESQLVGLPLNGRSYTQLATLQAAVSDPSAASASRGVGGGSLTVSGGRPSSNNFLLDGTNIMDSENQVPRSAAGVQLGSDAVFQVQVFSGNFGAEYGRGSGGVLNSITRSGTAQFHGTFFEYLRNSKLDARNFFDPEADPPPFKRNQFGLSVTGPVRKDRTFFLVSFEALRDRLSQTQVDHFPDEQARQGFPDAAGNPSVPVNPAVRPYLALYPLPNATRLREGIGENRATVFLPTNEVFFTTRVDHKLSDRDSFFVRYTFDDATSYDNDASVLFRTQNNSRQQYATVLGTHIFSLAALTAFRAGYTRPVGYQTSVSSIEIPASLYFIPGAPKFGIIVVPGLSTFGPSAGLPDLKIGNTFQFADDTLMQKGPHAMKWGIEVHRYRWDSDNDQAMGGEWSFNSLESFLRGGPAGTSVVGTLAGSNKYHARRQTLLGMYFQDSYTVRSNLQLSLGLRYEYASLISDRDGRSTYLPDPWRDPEPLLGPFLQHNPSGKDFAPRIGIAWSPGKGRNTTFSWGFGMYYDPILKYVFRGRDASGPYFRRASRTNIDATPYFPNAQAAIAGAPFDVRIFDYKHPNEPTVLRYNFSIQQQLSRGWRIQTVYAGARGNHLLRGYETTLFPFPIQQTDGTLFFPPDTGAVNPAFSSGAKVTSMDGQSFFNALQISFGKNVSRGVSFQGTYNYSKSVDDASNHSGDSNQFGFDRTLGRGLSDFDIRQRLSLNFFYSLPVETGRRWWHSNVLAETFGGWRLGGILSLRAGTPFTASIDVRTPRYLFSATQPDLAPGERNNPITGTTPGCRDQGTGQTIVEAGRKLGGPDMYFDPCSFSVPLPGTIGNLGRNTLITHTIFNMDVSLQREFALDAKRRLQFRAEFFNVPNHPTFGRPRTGVFTGAFPGRPNPTAGRINSTVTTSRQIQFALRFSF